jgi:hypothetical protein
LLKSKYVILALIVFIYASSSNAIVFDMSKAKFGSYLRSTYWNWGSKTPFSQSSGTSVSWSDDYTNLWSYEFGFLYNSGTFTWRFGLEFIQPPQLSSVSGKDSVSQTAYYSMDSSMNAYMPKIGLEMNLNTWKESRLWMMLEYGAATLTVQNHYSFTAAGTTKYGISDFTEVVSDYESMTAASLGFETLMTDNTTFSIETGYRFLKFNNMSQSSAVTNFQGAQPVGAPALQNDGVTKRDIAMSSPYVAINLRIWIY